jgi:opacity protein-like surface antigen
MRRHTIHPIAAARRALGLMAAVLTLTTTVSAQTQETEQSPWRISAAVGGFVPFSSLIRAADSHDTELVAGPAFSLEPQHTVVNRVSAYLNGVLAFPTIRLGSSIQPAVMGPSGQVMLVVGTAGVVVTASDWLGDHMQPTLRLGGGFKWYSFDLTGAENELRPTADIGLGLRGVGIGAIDVTVELRYLPSSFDQGKLPIRGISPQDQQQSDLYFSIGFGIRP